MIHVKRKLKLCIVLVLLVLLLIVILSFTEKLTVKNKSITTESFFSLTTSGQSLISTHNDFRTSNTIKSSVRNDKKVRVKYSEGAPIDWLNTFRHANLTDTQVRETYWYNKSCVEFLKIL